SGKDAPEERFDHDDKYKMMAVVRATPKTCLAFKVLGATRLCDSPEQVRAAFATVYQGIKPQDAIVVGMFPKYRDQIAENAQFAREILESLQPATV
ncbi:MAG: hypothetical protein HY706_12680, partial [Candidatus Hydrogenedentes bacterium]|nr:hypothetical protein [Candidatus Hydrogenedentota bacterium]